MGPTVPRRRDASVPKDAASIRWSHFTPNIPAPALQALLRKQKSMPWCLCKGRLLSWSPPCKSRINLQLFLSPQTYRYLCLNPKSAFPSVQELGVSAVWLCFPANHSLYLVGTGKYYLHCFLLFSGLLPALPMLPSDSNRICLQGLVARPKNPMGGCR